jgi:hypothetical protein
MITLKGRATMKYVYILYVKDPHQLTPLVYLSSKAKAETTMKRYRRLYKSRLFEIRKIGVL